MSSLSAAKKSRSAPPLVLLVLLLLLIASVLTYIIPAGAFDVDPETGATIAGTFHYIEKTPVAPWTALGLIYDGMVSMASTISLILYFGGIFGVFLSLGAAEEVVNGIVTRMRGKGDVLIIFVLTFLMSTIGAFAGWTTQNSLLMRLFDTSKPFYSILYFLLIIGFSYFYATMQFNPVEVSNNLKKNGGFIPGFRPGKPTSDFITKALGKVTFVGALFLAVVALLPLIVGAVNSSLRNVALGGTSVIIVVGVALDTVKQMEAQMLMRHHKGFLE